MSTQDLDTDDGTDLEINVDLAAGMRVEVEYEDTRPAYAYSGGKAKAHPFTAVSYPQVSALALRE